MSRLCFTDFQKRMGYVDVKLSPVYFYVQKWKGFNTAKTPIPFDVEILNIGGAMNLTLGNSRHRGMDFFHFHSPARLIFLNLHRMFIFMY